jgi:hypothetical protein
MDFDEIELLAANRTTICFLCPLFQACIVKDVPTGLYDSDILLCVDIAGMSYGGSGTPQVNFGDNLRWSDVVLGGYNVQHVQTDNTLISHAGIRK